MIVPLSIPRILKQMGSETNWFETLEKSWHFAESLRREHEIKRFLLAPSTKETLSKELASNLNQNLWNVGQGEKYDGTYDEGKVERYREGSTVFVDVAKTASEPNLLIGIQLYKLEVFKRQVDEFLSSVDDKKQFALQFSASLAETRNLLHKEPCLIYDFQALMDRNGNLYDVFSILQGTKLSYALKLWKK